jgi:hypothetical protein
MYSSLPHFVIAFHGCDKSVANKVVSRTNPHLISSKNKYDWLGHGIYFWEQNYRRALDFATQIKDHPEHKIPLSRGGTNEYANLAVACQYCNCSKGNKTEEEFKNNVFIHVRSRNV